MQDPTQAQSATVTQLPSPVERGLFYTDSEGRIDRGSVVGVGQPVYPHSRTFAGGSRIRMTGFIPVHGEHYLVRVSEPDPDQVEDPASVPINYIMPGWTEYIDAKGPAKDLHDEVADATPGSRTVSVANDGLSIHGQALPPQEALNRGFPHMADARLRIAAHYAGSGIVDVYGRSMGTILSVHMAKRNLDATPGHGLVIPRLNFISPGLVSTEVHESERFRKKDPETDLEKALLTAEFLGHMAADSSREALLHPGRALRAAMGYSALGVAMARQPGKALAILGHYRQMTPGTPWEMVKAVSEAHDIHIRVGDKDTVRETEQYKKLQELYPDRVRLDIHEGKGHAMSMNPKSIVAALAR